MGTHTYRERSNLVKARKVNLRTCSAEARKICWEIDSKNLTDSSLDSTQIDEQKLHRNLLLGWLQPNEVQTQMILGDVLGEMGQPEQARSAYERALVLAKTIEPEFQIRSIPSIERKLESVPKSSTVSLQ